MFMPAFRNRPKASSVVGRILAGYGDLELMLSQLMGMAIASKRPVRSIHTVPQHRIYYERIGLQKLYTIRGGDERIKKIKQVCKPAFAAVGLQQELQDLLKMVDTCRRYRNLFSHCLWARSKHRGLFFVDLEEHAKQPGLLSYKYRYASQTALEEIEMYNWMTVQWIGNAMDLFVIKAKLSRHHVALTMPRRPVLKEPSVLLPHKELH
jgi:hypothetical protein